MASRREHKDGTGAARPGGRTARVREAVQAAARAELRDKGFEGLSHRVIAARAGVDATTVYRRWPTRSRLVGDLLLDLAEQQVKVPDTGRVADDLAAYLRQVVLALAEPQSRRLALALCSLASTGDEDAAAALQDFWTRRFTGAVVMLERAVTRGELRAGLDHPAMIERLVAPAWFRVLLKQAPVDEAFISRSVALLLFEATSELLESRT